MRMLGVNSETVRVFRTCVLLLEAPKATHKAKEVVTTRRHFKIQIFLSYFKFVTKSSINVLYLHISINKQNLLYRWRH